MATIIKTWTAAAELLKTDAYGGSDDDLAADQQYDYTGDVNLETNGYQGVQVQIQYRGNNADTKKKPDKLIVDVFASLDGANYDSEPVASYILGNDNSHKQMSFLVLDLAHFRLGLKTSDTNTTFDFLITYQTWLLTNA